MITASDSEMPFKEHLGGKLKLHFDSTQQTDDKGKVTWYCTTAEVQPAASRGEIIEAVIRTKYSLSAELATINNATDQPDEYAAYQLWRAKAKQLATDALNVTT